MSSISHTIATEDVRSAPRAKTRNLSIDRTRTFLTLVVLLHHAVIPYTYFGHTDPKSWIGFDCVVLATDSFFMAMFFFLSGLFVWTGLARKGMQKYFLGRLLRLGLPFAICALTIIPLAYYAISLRQHPDVSFADFWWKTVTVGPWPSGPIWFLWVLFAFDLVAMLLYRLWPNLLDPINRLSLRGHDQPAKFFRSCLPSPPRSTSPGEFTGVPAIGSSLGRSRSSTAACCYIQPTSFLARALARWIWTAGYWLLTANWRSAPGLDDPAAHSILPHVGDDLYQAGNLGKSRAAAGLV